VDRGEALVATLDYRLRGPEKDLSYSKTLVRWMRQIRVNSENCRWMFCRTSGAVLHSKKADRRAPVGLLPFDASP
jgi:hypothetical protein